MSAVANSVIMGSFARTNPSYRHIHPHEGSYNDGRCANPPYPTGPTGACVGRVADVTKNDTMLAQHPRKTTSENTWSSAGP